MGLRTTMIATGDGLIDRLVCVCGAVGLSQMPEFIQQYLQRLGGHVDEARHQVEQFRTVATQSHETLEQLITQTTANADAAVSRLGQVMNDAVTRLQTLQSDQALIANAPPWKQPFVFLSHADPQIVHKTWSIFRPGIPFTLEGITYGVVGLCLFLTLYHFLVRVPVRATYRRRQRARRPLPEPVSI
jgi:Protein of unknown function (DUF2937)